MSQISKALLGLLFNGPDLELAAAPWKNNTSAIYGFNAAGSGYTVFKPGNNFNSLTKLVQDGAYIVSSVTLGYELPGAVLQAAGGQAFPNPLSIHDFAITVQPGRFLAIYYVATSLVDSYHLDRVDYASREADSAYDTAGEFNDESAQFFPLSAAGEEVTLTIRDSHGNKLVHVFTLPAHP